MPESGPAPAGAQSTARRSPFADALRGFALVGICVVNLPWIASSPPGDSSALDGAARLLVLALFEGKFFVLFSLLFGFGFQRQLERVRAGRATPSSYARRLVGLFVLGGLHATLLYVGDILTAYALLGAVLWAVRDLPDRRLLAIAGGCVAVAAVAFALLSWGGSDGGGGEGAAAREAARQAYLGSFAQALNQRLEDLPFGLLIVLLFNWPLAFAAFCAGVVAGRRGLLDDPARLARALPPVPLLAAGAVVGNIASAAAYRLPGGWPSGGAGALLAVGAPCLSALYLLALARAWRAPRARAFMERWLAPAGRMSLSNYLGQSLLANLLFMGWGFGLYGSLGAAALLPASLAIAAAGLVASRFWLRRFRAGPAERLLRAWAR
ncbi:DUF418 domain-containing protein [Craurococcus roseus]|uniref:DUF418 domain-containing protein n=1 Tax=Craurococcus roseus TaxID=77585 RepID=A0ABP3PXG3_9PROT